MYNITSGFFKANTKQTSKVLFRLVIVFFGAQMSWGQVALPHYDGLDYTVGQSLATQTDWTLNQTATTDLLITEGSLSYPGFAASTGNKVAFIAGGEDAIKRFTTTTGTVYYSYLMKVTTINNGTNTYVGYFGGFITTAAATAPPATAPGSGSIVGTVWARESTSVPGMVNFGLSARASQTTVGTGLTNLQYGTTNYAVNETVLVVVSYQAVAGSANDVYKLWINPTPGQPEPTATFTANSSTDVADVGAFFVRQNGNFSTPGVEIDEIRLGTTWEDVTPAGGPAESVVNLKLFVEGYYAGSDTMVPVKNNQDGVSPTNEVENITVELREAETPHAVVATTTATLLTDGTAICTYPSAPNGMYYIAVKTANTVQTWSANPQTIGAVPLSYDFTTAATQAYGNNMVDVGGVFAFFTGDITDGVSQDDLIDSTDYSIWETDNNNFAFGVYATDLNGDGLVDSTDYSIWETNNNNFVFASYPQ